MKRFPSRFGARYMMGFAIWAFLLSQAIGLVAASEESPGKDVKPAAAFSYVKILGMPLADALKTLKANGISTSGKKIDVFGSIVFIGADTGIECSLNEDGKVAMVVLNVLTKSEAGRYAGPVHAKLTSSASRDKVIADLGKPDMSTEKMKGPVEYKYPLIGYELPTCRLRFAFTRQEKALARVSFELKER